MLTLGMQVLIEDKSGCNHVVPFSTEQRENWRLGTCTSSMQDGWSAVKTVYAERTKRWFRMLYSSACRNV